MKKHYSWLLTILLSMSIGLSACNGLQAATTQFPETAGSPIETLIPAPTSTFLLSPGETALPTETPEIVPTATALPPGVDDILARCPAPDEVTSINNDIALQFEADPTAGTLVCSAANGSVDLTRLQERAYQALRVMQRIEFDQPLPWTDKPLYEWLIGTVNGIRFTSDEYSSCCDAEGFMHIQTDNIAALQTDRWIDPQMGTGLQGMMVLYVHEARHNEIGGHTCGNNDNTITEMGAWGVQYQLLMWLAYHTDRAFFHPADLYPTFYEEWALSEASSIRDTRFCSEPAAAPGPFPTLRP